MAKLYFYYSTMNAGKSTHLLQSSYNYRERGMNTVLFTPKLDTRYEEGQITSRIGIKADAVAIDFSANLFEYIKKVQDKGKTVSCILVDEAHFLPRKQILQLTYIVDKLDIPVLSYGLRTDFQGNLFSGSGALLGLADKLIEVKTICHCGKKAVMNMRIDDSGKKIVDGEQVSIGGNNRYIATCRVHFDSGDSGEKSLGEQISLKLEPEEAEVLLN